MPYINNIGKYPQDSTVSGSDFLIGHDNSATKRTKTYSLNSILTFISENYEGSGFTFRYAFEFSELGDENVDTLFTSNSEVTSGITTLNLNKNAISGIDVSNFMNALDLAKDFNNYYIILQSLEDVNIFAYLNILDIVDNTDYFTVSVSLVTSASAGTLADNTLYSFKFLISSVGAGGLGDMMKSTYDVGNTGVVDNAELVNGFSVLTAVPSGAVFTDTTYTDAEIKTKLENNPDTNTVTDAEKVDIGNISGKLDDVIAGANVTIDKTDPNNPIISGSAGSGVTNLSYDAPTRTVASDTGTDAVITEVVAAGNSGLLTGADKTKLDNISGTNTGDEVSASTTVAGISELATTTEINTGTDNTRAVTPSGLSNSQLQSDTTANNNKISADGSVISHNDVTDAGSGAIITPSERTKLQDVYDINTLTDITAASYTFVASDGGDNKVVPFNSATPQIATVDAGVHSAGDVISLWRRGLGSVEILEGTATIEGIDDGTGKYFINDQYSAVVLIAESTSLFRIAGNLTVPVVVAGEYGSIHVTTSITNTANGTPTKLAGAGVTISSLISDFIHTSPNRLTYTGLNTKIFSMIISLDSTHSANSTQITFSIAKNGVNNVSTSIKDEIKSGGDLVALTLSCIVELSTNDYVELYSDSNNVGTTTVSSALINIYAL